MKVLSLFDGISCGRVALERAGIPVECYDAFEIDKYAIQVSSNNYLEIVHHGNVFDSDFSEFEGYDLLLGGSPCTYWSIAKNNRETSSDGEGFRLFMQYVRALDVSKCRYFLYENNHSIHQNIKDAISEYLGVQPVMINSALVSAQHRKRCYWTNIPGICQPEDKGIMLADVIENGIVWQDKSFCMNASYHPGFKQCLEKHLNTMVAIPFNTVKGKSHTIAASYGKSGENPFSTYGCERGRQRVAIPVTGAAQRGRYAYENKTEQHIEVRRDGKSNCVTTVQKDSLVCSPVRIGQYGKGGQGQRIYSVSGKSVTLSANGGGQGAKTGLYKIDLPDGDYIIRKLTPVEAERLQTLPDNYTEGISNTQRYKCIGNGWTVDVIAHILKGLKE
ncbi:MAG: DNA (cytosine-5-)-methyltransferase [Oscillospiraceae bacterium]|nr:DNA (cytosine-5-)-methyltransferase [Oscillospiraceae bacterium]